MAVTYAATNTTPNCLQYRITADDATAGTRTQAQLVAACASGPLKEFLRGRTTAQFDDLNNNPTLEVIVLNVLASATVVSARFGAVSGSLSIQPSAAIATPGATVTLRYIPSTDR